MHVAVAAALVLLHGTVVRGLANPVPAAHVTLTFVRSDGHTNRVTTDGGGHYAVRLNTGSYAVRGSHVAPGGVWLIRSMQLDFVVRR